MTLIVFKIFSVVVLSWYSISPVFASIETSQMTLWGLLGASEKSIAPANTAEVKEKNQMRIKRSVFIEKSEKNNLVQLTIKFGSNKKCQYQITSKKYQEPNSNI